MKIKDLNPKVNLGEIIIKTPCGKIGYWKSQWNKGVWLQGKSSRIYPIFVEGLSETLDWEIVKDENLINLD